ncbi:Copiatype Polyprotein [Phytophthora palmivora]|uniref:Copiatype Polyprotein n=1 Tax=Phytophthora palmivora TaxID=4796 RepID=A0A2P4X9N7_9STRA|nr:Copiatype Polyprotein [Phytophthora palmivora]
MHEDVYCLGQATTWKPVSGKMTSKVADTMESWYHEKGIVLPKVGPKASKLNLVERTHQTLIRMVNRRYMILYFQQSTWVHALETAVYTKNRVHCEGTGRTLYELMYPICIIFALLAHWFGVTHP